MPLYYEDIAVSSGGESHLIRPIKVVDWATPLLGGRATDIPCVRIDELIASDSTPAHRWFPHIKLAKFDSLALYDDIGQNNPLAVTDVVTAKMYTINSIGVSEDVRHSGLGLIRSDVVDSLSVVENVPTPKFNNWRTSQPNNVSTTDRVTPYMSPRSGIMTQQKVEENFVRDVITPKYSKLTRSVSDTIGVASRPTFAGEGDTSAIYVWRFRYDY